jgi:hypothetical protein
MQPINTTVRIAVAAAIAAAGATPASALDISTYAGNAATNVNVYISGSTALDNNIISAAVQTAAGQTGVCQAGTIDRYVIGGPTNQLIYCTGNTASGVSGSPLAIFKESNVGSANGVQPLINVAKSLAAGTTFLDPSKVTDGACTTAVVAVSGDLGSYTNHTACTDFEVAQNPTGGFSDVEAAILRTASGGTISASDTSTYLTASPTLDQLWGVPVTKQLYYDLQAAEGLTSTCPASYTVYGAVVTGTTFTGVDSPSCAPSLSHSQVAGLYTGQIFADFNLGLSHTADEQIYLCRRDKGSGTEASFEAYFVNARCANTALTLQPENGTTVFANSSGGNMRNCLKAFQVGGIRQTDFYDTAFITTLGNQYAVGMLNMEITASNLSSASDAFRMIAVDGALPQIANVQNGYYPYFSTGNAYKITAGKTGAPTGNPLTAFNAIANLIGHPIWTKDNNVNYSALPWGVSGDLPPAALYAAAGKSPPTLPATHTTAAAVPTNSFYKGTASGISNCDYPAFDSTDLTGVPVQALAPSGTITENN